MSVFPGTVNGARSRLSRFKRLSLLVDMNWSNGSTLLWVSLCFVLRCLCRSKHKLTRMAGVETVSECDNDGVRILRDIWEKTVHQINGFKRQAKIIFLVWK